MRPTNIACPVCGITHEFSLRSGDDRHLRRCPDCQGWFVLSEAGGEEEIDALGEPATCPVPGCEETIPGDVLPEHVIENHDATLGPGSEGSQ